MNHRRSLLTMRATRYPEWINRNCASREPWERQAGPEQLTGELTPRCASPPRWPAVPAQGPSPTASTMGAAKAAAVGWKFQTASRSRPFAGGEVGSRPGSHNMGYVMRANSSALTLRLVWQSSLATVPFGGRFGSVPAHLVAQISPSGAENGRLCSKVCHPYTANVGSGRNQFGVPNLPELEQLGQRARARLRVGGPY